MKPAECPSESELHSYLARTRDDKRTAIVEQHLISCRPCRLTLLQWQQKDSQFIAPEELTECATRLGTPLPRSQRTYARWLPVAAAILIAITVGGLWRYFYSPAPKLTPDDPLRADNQRGPMLRGLAPAENAVVTGNQITFTWTTDGEAIRYSLFVLNLSGDIVFQSATNDPTMTLDLYQITLPPSQKYFWHVRAKLSDGSEIETKPSAFIVQPR